MSISFRNARRCVDAGATTTRTALLFALLWIVPQPAVAQPPSPTCGAANAPAAEGVVWQGTDRLGVREIAGLLAPALWFSADEPLLADGYPPMPTRHPCDAEAARAVVYYQITEIRFRGDTPVTRPEEDDASFADKVESFILKYYFYYPEDSGVGGHPHDLEAAEFEVWLEGDDRCRQVRLASVEALAHGSRWYSSRLRIRPDTRFPLMLFVEEGKHATAPDRNADGTYMRGYDVTERINDAWGVRDSLGQGVLLSSSYSPEMTKPRRDVMRILPPESPFLQTTPRQRSYQDGEPSLGRYELRPGNTVSACAQITPQRERLVDIMDYHGFGVDQLPTQHEAGANVLSDLNLPDSWLSASLRLSDKKLGAALIFKGLDLREGWIVPRVTATTQDATAELLFTPSASRWADYYFSGGVRRQYVTTQERRTIDTPNGRQDVDVVIQPNWNMVLEAGWKFRAELPRKVRPFVLGYSFGGMRFGLQAVGFWRVDQFRFIWEIGAGAW